MDGSDGNERSGADADRPRLLLDSMLGKLATYLRMCGYDAAYVLDDGPDPGDDAILGRVRCEERTLLTRDESLAARARRSVLLTRRDVTGQLREFEAAGYPVGLAETPARCGSCNGPVERVAGTDAVPAYAPDPGDEALWRCRDCGQVFWKGSHWDDVATRLEDV
ncbi:Mut7-C RNAse domain-containing protein [Halogeometricum limi]|uniref:Mut7-C RNAse domain-containing protein n=1 Tax=Halogeometricum limi TaxID=555875 RepID=A0A1I6G633_9EURY|nr:Mut7-C RNAse domain-containing protein [Halogeometricum limi]SFR37644.1 hypothetical protein SAMN04488124_0926 [Halogeometricum limi]